MGSRGNQTMKAENLAWFVSTSEFLMKFSKSLFIGKNPWSSEPKQKNSISFHFKLSLVTFHRLLEPLNASARQAHIRTKYAYQKLKRFIHHRPCIWSLWLSVCAFMHWCECGVWFFNIEEPVIRLSTRGVFVLLLLLVYLLTALTEWQYLPTLCFIFSLWLFKKRLSNSFFLSVCVLVCVTLFWIFRWVFGRIRNGLKVCVWTIPHKTTTKKEEEYY